MWPKLLLDLLPHFSRLLPVADKYLARISANEKAQVAELAALSLDVRKQMGRVTETQAEVARQLQQQSAQIAEIAVDVARTRMGIEGAEERIAKLEKTVGMAVRLLGVVLVLVAMTFVILVAQSLRVVK
jgi:chromosome segregation ATPase